eukprot:3750181-Pyramimonas_sp.AAC.1
MRSFGGYLKRVGSRFQTVVPGPFQVRAGGGLGIDKGRIGRGKEGVTGNKWMREGNGNGVTMG